jgi:Tfp pilus assembly protein PilF
MKPITLLAHSLRVAVAFALLTTQVLPAEDLRPRATVLDMLIQKARSLEARDRDDLAAQVWQQVLVTNPNQPDALAGLARWAKHSGKSEEANAYLSRLRRASPDAPALNQLEPVDSTHKSSGRLDEAGKLAANGHFDEAMRIYREVFGTTPPAGGWTFTYYETLANTAGGFEPAVAALKKLAATYPDVPAYQAAAGKLMTYRPASRQAGIALLSSVSGSTSAASKAREAWRQALIWEKANPAYAPALQAYLSRYNDPELQTASAAMRTQTARMEPQGSDSREEQLGYRALKNGNMAEAERQFSAALAKDDESGRAHAGLGFVRLKAGDFDKAVEQFEAAHKASPTDTAVRNSLDSARFWKAMRLGAKSTDEGDWTEAVVHYQAAIALRPNDEDALRGLGGSLLAAGLPIKAIPYLSKAVRRKTLDETSWCALVQAKLSVAGGKAALAVIQSVPEAFAATLDHNLQWKALEASAYADGVDNEKALEIYRELMAGEHTNLTAAQQLELASLALHFHEPAQALPFAEKALETTGEKTGPWEVLLAALVGSGRPQEAERVYARMPAKAQKIAATHPAFLETQASLKEATGDLDGAEALLEKSLAMAGTVASEPDRTSAKLHLAQLLAKLGRGSEAEAMVTGVAETRPDDVDTWRTRLLILQTLGLQNEIVTAAARMPQSVAVRLAGEGDMVTLLARTHAAGGDNEGGVKLLEAYIARNSSDPADSLPQRIQLAWLLLNSPSGSGRLYPVLDGLNARTDLNVDQRKEVTSLWTTWILRSAETARRSGNEERAVGLLEQGSNMFPGNADLLRGLAGNLLAAGKTKRAFNVYSNWGLADAQADDYAGAIGAALAEHNAQYADAWINSGLAQWPNNPKLLELAGERAQASGDLKRAEMYWKEALAQKQLQSKNQVMASGESGQSLKTLLVGTDSSRRESSQGLDGNSNGRNVFASPSDRSAPEVHLSSFQGSNGQPREDFVGGNALFGGTVGGRLETQGAPGSNYLVNSLLAAPAEGDSLEDKIAGLESRNTPYLDSRMSVWSRGGESGFSRLVIEQAQFEASTTLGNSLRASLLLEPTYLAGGTASGTGDSLFGTQTSPASFGSQNASGIGAEAQLSSQSFGMRVGTSPQGFLTHNWIGGLRVQPKHGPITIILERDSVKDTILSYAGARDPQSGQIWGGVMANSASVQGRWGNGVSGIYVSGGYQTLEGRNVVRNTGVNGNFGTWWKVAVLPTGNLTVGMNFSAMHYENNLRYFTLGEGGYFSPQQYFLFNVPVRWTGSYGHRLQYTVGGSLGPQHFVEDASEYYGYRYPALASTGANFSFDARLNYQLAPHWVLGSFVTASNARNYTAASAGIFAKYTFEERPMSFDNALPSVPDWRGQQPFLIY